MNKKIIYICIIIGLIVLGLFTEAFKIDDKKVIHQHLANEKEIKTEGGDEFNTHLPFVTIETGGQAIPGEEKDGTTIRTNFKIYDKEKGNNFITDVPTEETLANIRYRGASSMGFAKKSYLVKFIKENEEENNIDALRMGKHDEWILNGPFMDKTLMRNYMWYNISAEIMGYAPEVRFCELFVNDDYKGVYLLLESISRGNDNRIDITKYDKRDDMTSYIVRLDRGDPEEIKNINNFTKYTKKAGENLSLDIKYPSGSSITPKLNKYISDDLRQFEKALYSFDYKEYEKYINVDSFVDYFIINEFTQNNDAGKFSTYLYKDIRGKLNLAVWDFNSVCNNYEVETLEKVDFVFQNNLWFEMLLKDPKFVDKIVERYHELRKTYLNEEYLLNYIDETRTYLGDSIERNYKVWGYTFLPENDLFPEGRKIGSYEEAISQYKDFIIKRGRWLDENIERLYEFSHPSVNKKYNH